MQFKSLLFAITIAFSFNLHANVISQGAQSLLEVITKKVEVSSLLERREIFTAGSESLETISNDFGLLFKAYGIRGKRNLQNRLLSAIKSIKPINDDDKKIIENVIKTLNKKVDDLSNEELANAHDELLYLASRYGKKGNVILVCLDCTAGTEVTAKGFKYTFQELNDSKAKSMLRLLRSMGPKAVSNFIKNEMSNVKYGDYSKISGSALSADQELAFALFLKLGKEGNGHQKAYVRAVERVLGKNSDGSVNFFDSRITHNLHMFFQDNYELEYLKKYTEFINDIADLREAEGLGHKEAFENVLKSKAMKRNAAGELEEDPVLMRNVNEVAGRCPMFRR